MFYDRYEGNISFALISNPPTTFTPLIRFGRLQELDPNNALLAPSGLNAQSATGRCPSTYNFNAGLQKKLPGGVIWDIAYVGSIANHLPRQVNANAVPYGARFLPENQDPTLPRQHAARPERPRRQLPAALRRATTTSTCGSTTPTRTTTACRPRSIAASPTACS